MASPRWRAVVSVSTTPLLLSKSGSHYVSNAAFSRSFTGQSTKGSKSKGKAPSEFHNLYSTPKVSCLAIPNDAESPSRSVTARSLFSREPSPVFSSYSFPSPRAYSLPTTPVKSTFTRTAQRSPSLGIISPEKMSAHKKSPQKMSPWKMSSENVSSSPEKMPPWKMSSQKNSPEKPPKKATPQKASPEKMPPEKSPKKLSRKSLLTESVLRSIANLEDTKSCRVKISRSNDANTNAERASTSNFASTSRSPVY